jgi:hypothetical protein
MAITEPRGTQPGHGEPPATGPAGSRRRRRWRWRWRRWALAGLVTLLAATVAVLAVLAGTYQPVQFGGESGGVFPGLPNGDRAS